MRSMHLHAHIGTNTNRAHCFYHSKLKHKHYDIDKFHLRTPLNVILLQLAVMSIYPKTGMFSPKNMTTSRHVFLNIFTKKPLKKYIKLLGRLSIFGVLMDLQFLQIHLCDPDLFLPYLLQQFPQTGQITRFILQSS